MSTPPTVDESGLDDLDWLRDLDRGPQLREWLRQRRLRYDVVSAAWMPLRDALREAALDVLPASVETPAWTVADAVFRWRWEPGHDHPMLLMTRDGAEQVVLDVGALTTTGFVRLGDVVVSPDARRIAWSVDVVGDEAYALHVNDLGDPQARATTVTDRCYYGLAWSRDSARLLSVTHDSADRPFQLWCHDLAAGTSRLLHDEPDERFHLALRLTGDPQWSVLRAASRLTAEEWLVPLDGTSHAPITTRGRTDSVDYTCEPVTLDDEPLLAVSRQTSDDGYTVTLEPRAASAAARMLLPDAEHRRPLALLAVDDHLVVEGRDGGHATVWSIDLRTAAVTAQVSAAPGTSLRIAAYDARPGHVLVENASWTSATWWDELDLSTGATRRIPARGSEPLLSDDLVVETLSIPARDGVQIPVSVLRRTDVALDGSAPCLLYGYGAWETVIDPDFDTARLALVRSGVVYAHAHVRGGGELGRGWWRQGRMNRKATTFDDFVDVASALGRGIVDSRRIVAMGLSAGGLLMGAAYSRAPELFAGVLAEAPFVDPVTTMSDPTQPLVVVERDEWGDPRREADRAWMLSWSPLHNPPEDHRRPRLLVTSALHDPRVSVWEPARWVARLDPGATDDRVLLRVDLGSRGHWSPPGRVQFVGYRAELLAWVADTMGLSQQDVARRHVGGGGRA